MYYGLPWRGPRLRRFYRPFVQPGDLCFDVGAHVGNRTQALLDLGARVVALEPQPAYASFLRRKFAQRAAATVIEAALGAKEGQAGMWISRRTPTVSSLSSTWLEQVADQPAFEGVNWDRYQPVAVTTLDSLIEEWGEPVFCKIDAEGSEYDILLGLSRPLRSLSFEIIPQTLSLARDCIGRLQQLADYEYNWIVGEGTRFQIPAWVNAEEMWSRLKNLDRGARPGDVYARRQS
jgi:FkbM family methyltransferase